MVLAARGRARSVVALAPAGGWAEGDESCREVLDLQAELQRQLRALAPHAGAIAATPEGRRRATRLLTVEWEHIPAGLVAHQMIGAARCVAAGALIEQARRERWRVEPERIACPVRVVWGTHDRMLPWPSSAACFRSRWLPHADWVVLDGVGHCPQLDRPLETAELILGLTAG